MQENETAISWDTGDSHKAIKSVDGATSAYNVSTKRYHVEATKAQVKNTVPLDMTIVNELCKDEDGCSITIGMRDWASSVQPGNIASSGPYKFFMSESSNWWRLSDDVIAVNTISFQSHRTDEDGNAVLDNGNVVGGQHGVRHILRAHDCYFTDGEYTDAVGVDSAVGFGLLNWFASFNDPNMVCVLDIDD